MFHGIQKAHYGPLNREKRLSRSHAMQPPAATTINNIKYLHMLPQPKHKNINFHPMLWGHFGLACSAFNWFCLQNVDTTLNLHRAHLIYGILNQRKIIS